MAWLSNSASILSETVPDDSVEVDGTETEDGGNSNEEYSQNTPAADDNEQEIPPLQDEDEGSSSRGNTAGNRGDSFDFSQAKRDCPWPTIESSPDTKHFRVCRKGKKGNEKMIVVVKDEHHKDSYLNTFKRLAAKFGLNMKRMVMEYHIFLQNNKGEHCITIENDEDLQTSLNFFYCQCEEASRIFVDEKVAQPKRKLKPCETSFKKMKTFYSLNKEYYKYLQSNAEAVEVYIKKLQYVQLLMGTDSDVMNFLNPSQFICHVPACKQIINLRSINNITSITDHWKSHSVKSNKGFDASCETLIKRHNYCKAISSTPWKFPVACIDDLEAASNSAGESLSVVQMMQGKFLAQKGKQFKGSSLLVDMEVMNKIVERDPLALQNISSESRNIENLFGQQ